MSDTNQQQQQQTPPVNDQNNQPGDGQQQQQAAPQNNQQQQPPKQEPVKQPSQEQVDSLSSFIAEAGLDVKSVIAEVTKNDGEPSPAILKALIEKHGEAVANLIVGQMKGLTEVSKQRAKERDEAVYKLMEKEFEGITQQPGKDSWNELSAWAKDNVDVDTRKELNALLAQGGLKAELAIKHLVGLFKGRQGLDMQSAVLLDADGTSNQSVGDAIDKMTYVKELDKLLSEGHVYGQSQAIRQLDARRQKGIRRGI